MEYEKLLKRAMGKVSDEAREARFEPPAIDFLVEGNRTIIKNFSELAAALRRDSNHLLKFFSRELASFGEVRGSSVLFLGKFSGRQLADKLELYIDQWVLCPACKRPDTVLVREEGKLRMKCEACGLVVRKK